jgi:hypothetical protein
MEIISESVILDVGEVDAARAEPPESAPEPEPAKRRAPRAKAAPKARARKPLECIVEAAPAPPPEPEPAPVLAPAPKTRARKPPSVTPAPPSAPGISDVLSMLASALLDQRQTRTAQRQAMYSRFLD